MKTSIISVALVVSLVALSGCVPYGTCGSSDPESLELNEIQAGEYGQRSARANFQASTLEALLGYEAREDVYLRVVSDTQIEKVYVRDGQTFVEVYRVRSIGESVGFY